MNSIIDISCNYAQVENYVNTLFFGCVFHVRHKKNHINNANEHIQWKQEKNLPNWIIIVAFSLCICISQNPSRNTQHKKSKKKIQVHITTAHCVKFATKRRFLSLPLFYYLKNVSLYLTNTIRYVDFVCSSWVDMWDVY